ncbi:MAG: hypothetical protein HRT68_07920 [Flavobacteriaceae bacterium]|nr:hypothetical protein [Flavobacteriaceae bacterium]
MKRIAFVFRLLVLLIFVQCKTDQKKQNEASVKSPNIMTISGYFGNIGDGTQVTLKNFGASSDTLSITYTQHKMFSFDIPKRDDTVIYEIDIKGFDGFLPVISSQNDLVIRMNIDDIYFSDISGDAANEGFSEYKRKKDQLDNQVATFTQLAQQANLNEEGEEEWNKRLRELQISVKTQYNDMIVKNINNFTSGLIMEDLLQGQIITPREGMVLFNKLPDSYKNSFGGKTTYQYLMLNQQ